MIPEADKIIIREEGKPAAKEETTALIDTDWLLVAGALFAEVGVLAIWWPLSLILASLFCFGYWCLLSVQKSARKK